MAFYRLQLIIPATPSVPPTKTPSSHNYTGIHKYIYSLCSLKPNISRRDKARNSGIPEKILLWAPLN